MKAYAAFNGTNTEADVIKYASALLSRTDVQAFFALPDSFDKGGLDADLVLCTVLVEATPAGLATFAAKGKAQEATVDSLLANTMLMRDMLVAGSATNGHKGVGAGTARAYVGERERERGGGGEEGREGRTVVVPGLFRFLVYVNIVLSYVCLPFYLLQHTSTPLLSFFDRYGEAAELYAQITKASAVLTKNDGLQAAPTPWDDRSQTKQAVLRRAALAMAVEHAVPVNLRFTQTVTPPWGPTCDPTVTAVDPIARYAMMAEKRRVEHTSIVIVVCIPA
jgi:hypothetical protein